jgi:DNA-binding transcriptional regulator YiaG
MDSKDVKELRQSLGLSQSNFASKLGMTITTVNRWENGKCKPSNLAAEKLEKLQSKIKKLNSTIIK